MKRNETVSNSKNAAGPSSTAGQRNTRAQAHASSFAKVLDGRKQPIRGLWQRGGRFYAQLRVENPVTGIKKTKRVPIKDKDGNAVKTTAHAVAELKRLHTQRADNTLPVLERTSRFADYAKRYLDFIGSGQGAKKGRDHRKGTGHPESLVSRPWLSTAGPDHARPRQPLH